MSSTATVAPDSGRRFGTYADLMALTKEASPPELVKMDIEGFELSVLRAMLPHPRLLPTQLAVEVHFRSRQHEVLSMWHAAGYCPLPLSTWTCLAPAAELASFANDMWREGGYLLVDRHDNARCQTCSEVLFARVARPAHRIHPV